LKAFDMVVLDAVPALAFVTSHAGGAQAYNSFTVVNNWARQIASAPNIATKREKVHQVCTRLVTILKGNQHGR